MNLCGAGGHVVTLVTPLQTMTDQHGFLWGAIKATWARLKIGIPQVRLAKVPKAQPSDLTISKERSTLAHCFYHPGGWPSRIKYCTVSSHEHRFFKHTVNNDSHVTVGLTAKHTQNFLGFLLQF